MDNIEKILQKLQAIFFTRSQQQAFLEDISTLIEDGVPANQAIQTVAEVATGTLKKVATNIMQKIAEGKLIADGMQGWFAQPIVEIIRAGEEGGTLSENMMAAARSLAQHSRGFGSIINSTVYPLTVVAMGLIVAVFVKHSVFANFANIRPVSEWPQNGQVLYYVATFTENWWWLIVLIIIGFIGLIVRLSTDLTGDARRVFDQIPILSLYRDATAARFMEILGLLISNGVVLKKALGILRFRANSYLAWHIYQMEIRLSGGRENIAEVLDTGLIQKSDILRLRVVAKGRGFEHALVRLGQFAADRTAKKIQMTGRFIGIILMAAGATWAGFMIFSIYAVGSFVAT